MTKALVAIADGSEEMEAVTVIDVLCRAGIEVVVASVMPGSLLITASRGVKIQAGCEIQDCAESNWDVLVLPGGMPGAEHLKNCDALIQLVKRQINDGRWLAAICASPAIVLGGHNVIENYKATCYPGFESGLSEGGANFESSDVVVDRNLITSRGPGTATAFALRIIQQILGDTDALKVAEGMLVPQHMWR